MIGGQQHGGHAAHAGRRAHADLRRGAAGGRQRRAGRTTPGTTTPTGPVSARVKSLIAQANSEFQAAQAALKAGDFSGYGAKIRALASTLKSLQAAR